MKNELKNDTESRELDPSKILTAELEAQCWNRENAEFIQLYNAEIEANGTVLQEWRQF